MQTNQSGYLKFIAYLQIIGIILVVAGHSLHEYPDGALGQTTVFYRSLLTFRMPLFMFVSGFLMVFTTQVTTKAKRTPGNFIVNKLKRLILPYIVLTTVTFIPRVLMSSVADDVIECNLSTFVLGFVYFDYLLIPFFWFIQASFILLVVNYVVLYYGRKFSLPPKVIVPIMLLLFLLLQLSNLPEIPYFALSKIKMLGFYFVAGCFYALFAPNIDRYVPWTQIYFIAVVIIMWAVLYYFTIDTPYVVCCSICGIVMCISFAKILEERNWSFLDHLMGANYMIFLTSWYCNVLAQQVLAHFVTFPWWVHSALSLMAGVYIPWLGYKYLERHQDSRWVRVTSFLLGQSFKHKKHVEH